MTKYSSVTHKTQTLLITLPLLYQFYVLLFWHITMRWNAEVKSNSTDIESHVFSDTSYKHYIGAAAANVDSCSTQPSGVLTAAQIKSKSRYSVASQCLTI